PSETGVVLCAGLARGQLIGAPTARLNLLLCHDASPIIALHVFGTGATEIVHLGQAVISLGGTVDYLVDAVFNYPTLAEAYKVAALDAANKIDALARAIGRSRLV